MKLECRIDGKLLSFSVNSNKPLSLILIENLDSTEMKSNCRGNMCGNCIVLINDKAALSCLVPAFKLQNADITTFEAFRKTKNCRQIFRAYEKYGNKPCPNCIGSRTLIIESILKDIESNKMLRDTGQTRITDRRIEDIYDIKDLERDFSLNTCNCITPSEMINIMNLALKNRRITKKSNVRRS